MQNRGLMLIELLIALVISSLLIAGIYHTFLNQHKTYTIQEQVADVQQNVRASVSAMIEDIRMAGFGNVSTILPVSFGGRTFANVVNPDSPVAGALTIVSAIGETATITAIPAQHQITVSRLTDEHGNALFDTADRKYVSIGGLESHTILSIDGSTNTLTLDAPLRYDHAINKTLVFGIRAISYQLFAEEGRLTLTVDRNLGQGPEPLADDIENVEFQYLDKNGNPTAIPSEIRIVRVVVTARTNTRDPGLGGDGYRRRQIVTNVYIRNMEVSS